MKKLLALAVVALMAGAAFAQPGMGVFFATDSFTDSDTNKETTMSVPFEAYVVVLASPVSTIGAYECGLTVSDPSVFILNVSGPNGWTNFGAPLNHLCGYQNPVVADIDSDYAVLATIQMMQTVVGPADITMGPADPSSVGGAGPAITDGTNPENLITCVLTNGGADNVVATLNGDGIVATEPHSLSAVKALFN